MRQASLLNKLEKRFHNAGHSNVKFIIITDNETSATRLREASGNLKVIVLNETESSPFTGFVQRSAYIFDNCGQLAYIIHYPWSTVMRPFVKAATLSTIFDEPCGYCEATVSVFNLIDIVLNVAYLS